MRETDFLTAFLLQVLGLRSISYASCISTSQVSTCARRELIDMLTVCVLLVPQYSTLSRTRLLYQRDTFPESPPRLSTLDSQDVQYARCQATAPLLFSMRRAQTGARARAAYVTNLWARRKEQASACGRPELPVSDTDRPPCPSPSVSRLFQV